MSVTLHSSAPVMPRVGIESLTPLILRQMLEKNGCPLIEGNRALNRGHVDSLAKEMKEGRWRMNGDPLRITRSGWLVDGQHRAFAAIQADFDLITVVISGLEDDIFPWIDTGRKIRNNSTVLSLAGYKNTAALAAATRWVGGIRDNNYANVRKLGGAISATAILAQVNSYEPELVEAVTYCANKKGLFRLVSPSILAPLYYLAQKEDAQLALTYLQGLETGANLPEHHPALTVRSQLQIWREGSKKEKVRSIYQLGLLILGWNHLASNAGLKRNTTAMKLTPRFGDKVRRMTPID